MNEPKHRIIKTVLTLLNNIFTYLKDLLTSGLSYFSKQEPKRELNKPSDQQNTGAKQKKIIWLFPISRGDHYL